MRFGSLAVEQAAEYVPYVNYAFSKLDGGPLSGVTMTAATVKRLV
jgi:hypothetical protein